MKLSKKDHLSAAGLLYLAQQVNRRCQELTEALAEVLGEESENGFGHICDAVMEPYTLDELLRKLDGQRKDKARR